MIKRQYYSARTGKNTGENFPIETLRELVFKTYYFFYEKEYFQEAFGKMCVDAGLISGTCGSDIQGYFLRKLRKHCIWPIDDFYMNYSDDDIFDVIELLFDLVSKPIEGTHHDWSNCGWHYSDFDKNLGQEEFRVEINEILRDYKQGYELSNDGEILLLGDKGLGFLLEAKIPEYDLSNVDNRVGIAILKFRRYRASLNERKDAVRDLADVLEYLRPQIKEHMLSKDESELYNIANNFAIRHHNDKQKKDYDALWLSWIFYIYLSTIHMMLRTIKRAEGIRSTESKFKK
ncbi:MULTISPECIES: hypothetical protein [unclassified Paenibacillus]|uniref:hypothetical protein n=1 Tax=unclassified Paenibacillus TaxID=185978 RepID=UPI0009A63EAC|nr:MULTISPECIES: hypothetical protein [unclassified Paenibacillus]SLK12951.1 hypothetical protein SAMN06272722_10822 [Paenibacillus sp. RU5A]SOC72771.1 hypothetical protein SAMN05880581_10822 [Paenibacillus sp. RU26A]SOC75050.1 hypothetical protein SAMN05880586_10822 [Paenibacillus sp. RU5M]